MAKVQIAIRVDDELLSKIEEVEDDMQIDRSEAIRRLLDKGSKQYRLEKAIKQLRDKKNIYF
ncbi:ribbon-helix-helix protein, CopG family [Methanonatronarchaeum sp. AMET-Sl]|uniref:ribbon-helix-helix protein, CopG family n=1 Tax=Methanonatronarchaeum sp. AMET-Sl TaxID=3037654 RepID=UPI00244DB3AF|nr:ribbon-helix-helix protein, CopG family [Methanonatronarchaeum sp. AMET-Sl]WGI17702.1 ribbon-helix-helix protein, CopG family [Methanonatronarchaeum sp. AMET-Sl]